MGRNFFTTKAPRRKEITKKTRRSGQPPVSSLISWCLGAFVVRERFTINTRTHKEYVLLKQYIGLRRREKSVTTDCDGVPASASGGLVTPYET
jgi:hypothetical protein